MPQTILQAEQGGFHPAAGGPDSTLAASGKPSCSPLPLPRATPDA